MRMTYRAAGSAHVSFTIQSLGAQLGPAVFVLPDGRQVSPLHIAPWADEVEAAELPGILRALRGEWPCVPYGYGVDLAEDTPARWRHILFPARAGEEVHGHSSNNLWRFEEAGEGALALSITYPDESPIKRLWREVRAVDGAPALDFTLKIETRRACRLPLGLHFTFALPEDPQSARIEPAPYARARSYPGSVEPEASLFAIDQEFPDLAQAPGRNGGTVDATRVPLAARVEELVQLDGIQGEVALAVPTKGYRAKLTWDAEVFPSMNLWYSNLGRTDYPWKGRHLALGLEPICSPFGLSPETATSENPVNAHGIATARDFAAGEVLTTRYRLSVEPLEA